MNDDEYEERKKKEEYKKKETENKNKKNIRNKEFSDNIHMEIHAVRRLTNYKSSPMEQNISKFVIARFKEECKECNEIGEKKKAIPKQKDGILTKLGNLADKA